MRDLKTYHKDATTRVENTEGTGAALLSSTTYYVELCDLGGDMAALSSITWAYDGTIVATITVEASNFPEVSTYSTSAQAWKQVTEIPSVSIGAGTAGMEIGSWVDQGYGRLRAKVAVTTGGVLRGAVHHKERC